MWIRFNLWMVNKIDLLMLLVGIWAILPSRSPWSAVWWELRRTNQSGSCTSFTQVIDQQLVFVLLQRFFSQELFTDFDRIFKSPNVKEIFRLWFPRLQLNFLCWKSLLYIGIKKRLSSQISNSSYQRSLFLWNIIICLCGRISFFGGGKKIRFKVKHFLHRKPWESFEFPATESQTIHSKANVASLPTPSIVGKGNLRKGFQGSEEGGWSYLCVEKSLSCWTFSGGKKRITEWGYSSFQFLT